MSWGKDELSSLNLEDTRLNRRCTKLLDQLSTCPTKSIPASCKGWSETMAAYRFLSNEKVTPTKILTPHVDSMKERARQEKIILCIQDTTEINYSTHTAKSGIGPLNSETHRGLLLHPTVVITPDKLCLGVLDVHTWYRKTLGENKAANTQPIEEKESYRWLQSYRKSQELANELTETTVISIADREGDIYEIFLEYQEASQGNRCEYIIRAYQNRCVISEKKDEFNKLGEQIKGSPILGHLEFNTPSGRGKKSRPVKQMIQAKTIFLKSPQSRRPRVNLPSVKVTVVLATEVDSPLGEEPITWLLLTSLSVDDFASACKIINYYLCRWQIEIFFKILKSGCKIEELHLQKEKSVLICLQFYLIIAWRVLYLTMLGRQVGELSCEVAFESHEWKSTYIFVKRKAPPSKPPSLDEIVRMIAGLGGFLNRKGDGFPGPQTVWIGLQRMRDITNAWLVFNKVDFEHTCV